MRNKVPELIHLFLESPFSAESIERVEKEQYPKANTSGRVAFWHGGDKPGDDFMCCKKTHGSPLAGWMSRSVRLKDWKAAYHVWNRKATDTCHLQSFIIPLPVSVPLSLVRSLFFLPHCPHFQSIPATYISHHSNCSLLLLLLLPLQHEGMKRVRWLKMGTAKTEGTICSFWRTHAFWKVLLRQQKPFL